MRRIANGDYVVMRVSGISLMHLATRGLLPADTQFLHLKNQSVAVNAHNLGSLGLVPAQLLQHPQNKLPLKLVPGFFQADGFA